MNHARVLLVDDTRLSPSAAALAFAVVHAVHAAPPAPPVPGLPDATGLPAKAAARARRARAKTGWGVPWTRP